ncbi:hypothetical protein V1520DRAFT_350594 [Lipomyces starkeyi]
MRNRVIIAMAVQMWAQLSGMNVMMYYIVYIHQSAGVANLQLFSSIQYLINMIMTIPPIIWIDKWGRRPALLLGAPILGFWFFVIGALLKQYGEAVAATNQPYTSSATLSLVALSWLVYISPLLLSPCHGVLWLWCTFPKLCPSAFAPNPSLSLPRLTGPLTTCSACLCHPCCFLSNGVCSLFFFNILAFIQVQTWRDCRFGGFQGSLDNYSSLVCTDLSADRGAQSHPALKSGVAMMEIHNALGLNYEVNYYRKIFFCLDGTCLKLVCVGDC